MKPHRSILTAIVWLVVTSPSVQAEVIATVSKSEADGFGQHIPGSEFSCANSGLTCVNTSSNTASVTGDFTSETQTSFALARGAYTPTQSRGFAHPNARLVVGNRGNIGNRFGGVSAQVEITDQFSIRSAASLTTPTFPVQISRFEIELYDEGVLFTPALRRFFHGGHGVEYERTFSANPVRGEATNTAAGFVLEAAPGSTFRASVSPNAEGPVSETVNNVSTLSWVLAESGAPGFGVTQNNGLLFDFEYTARLNTSHIAFGLDPTTEAFGDFGSTAGVAGLSVFDDQGNDITHLIEVTNAQGDVLFSPVPEPSSALLLIAGVGLVAMRRRQP